MLDLFDLLDGRVIVFSDAETRNLVTWNESLTFQFWRVCGEECEEYHIVTLSECPKDFKHAQLIARALFTKQLDEY